MAALVSRIVPGISYESGQKVARYDPRSLAFGYARFAITPANTAIVVMAAPDPAAEEEGEMPVRKWFLPILVIVALLAVAVAGVNFLRSGAFGGQDITSSAASCPPASPITIGKVIVPAGPIAGYCQDRLVNAAQIMTAARSLGIGPHTQAIGVMTALGESGLRVLNYGDAAGADSRGLFQQRDNGAWGTLADRMDPFTSALHFFTRLVTMPGWRTLTPGQAAHAVQVNADPNHYDRYWDRAQLIVTELSR